MIKPRQIKNRTCFLGILALIFLSAFLLTGCFGPWDQKQSALDPQGPVARMQHEIFMLTLYLTCGLFLMVGGTLAFTVWKFRRRRGDDPDFIPKQSHGHPLVEIGLIAFAAAVLVIIAIPTLRGIIYMDRVPDTLSENAITVNVTGFQWWWEFEYPDEGIVTANELVIPAGRAVHLNLRSDDVIHSFWVPKLVGKKDLIPGQENTLWIQADEPGYFYGQCAEFCGDSHAYMLFRVIALDEDEFDAWVRKHNEGPVYNLAAGSTPADTGADPQIQQGAQAFQRHCIECHRIGNTGGVTGPNLTHFGSRTTIAAGWLDNNEENVRRWLKEPERIKPGNLMYNGLQGMRGLKDRDISDDEIESLAAFLSALQ